MSRTTNITASILLSMLVAREAAAQWNVARFATERNRVYTTAGLDPALVTSMGYGRVLSVVGHDFQFTGDAGIGTASLDVADFRARIGTQTSLAQWRSVNLTGSATFISRGTKNSIYRGFNFGSDISGTLGVYRPRWFAASEVGFDKAIITHVKHTDWYRKNYYADAKDGWYLDAGGTYRYGVTSGVSFGNTEIAARVGWLRTERFDAVTPPMYATLGVGFKR